MRKDIQGLRALAVVLVVFSHLPQWGKFAGGFVGVDMFFVISGFVITRLMVKKAVTARGVKSEYWPFMARRIVRLVPALFVMLIVGLLLSFLFAPPTEFYSIWGGALWSELFASNFYFLSSYATYWNPELLRNPFLHTWSLGVEFQTYVVLPLIAAALFIPVLGKTRQLKRAVWAISAFTLVSAAVFIFLVYIRQAPIRGFDPLGLAFYTPVSRFWEFGFGALAALLAALFVGKASFVGKFAPLAWVLIIAGTLLSHQAGTISGAVFLVCAGMFLLLWGGEENTTYLGSRMLSTSPFVWLGDRSYSFYLWHWPMLMLAIWVLPGWVPGPFLAVLFAIGLSMASYRFIEQRLKYSSGKTFVSNWRPTILISLVTTVVLIFSSFLPSTNWFIAPASATTAFPESQVTGADVTNAAGDCQYLELEIHCSYFGPDTPEVVVIGDSLGYRAFPAVALAAKNAGFNASQLWTGGCSIEFNSCPDFVYDYLGSSNLAAIVVATNFDRASNLVNGNERAAGLAPLCPTETKTVECALHQENVAKFREAADQGLGQLSEYTPNILVALPFPQQELLIRTCLNPSMVMRLLPIDPHCASTPVSWQIERQGLYPQAINDVVQQHPGVSVWNPMNYLCTETECPGAINNGEIIMDDSVHWSPAASRFLYPAFEQFISTLK